MELIEPILDNSIFYEINQFAGNIVNWAATKNDNSIKEAKSYHEEITIVLTKIIDKKLLVDMEFRQSGNYYLLSAVA